MVEEVASKSENGSLEKPLVFISHDSRDAELAEAFSKLLKSVSAGMLKSFRSSDKKGSEGIEFGDDWYKRLMVKLDSASDVVCLLTERSLDRPWILYEAGVAKGKLETPVHGVALGVPLSRVSNGPFYQFQNSDDSEDSLTKLVLQLCRRIAGLEPDEDVVLAQVQVFKQKVNEVIVKLQLPKENKELPQENEAAVAKVLEEMKLIVRELPMRIEQQMIDGPERYKSKRMRRFHPMMIDEMAHMISRRSESPIGLLVIASVVKEDFPWLYELGVEAYRAAKSGDYREAREAMRAFRDASEFTLRSPFMKEMGFYSKDARMQLEELPMAIDLYMNLIEKPRMKESKDEESSQDETNS
jgi:hypothetical protein